MVMKYLWLMSAAVLILGGIAVWSSSHPSTQEAVTDTSFTLEIADTDAKRIQGLSGRTEVPDNYGMLFVFPEAQTYGFWMKDMYVPIDIIWLREDGSIIGIEDSVSPDTYPDTFYAPEPIRYVLETRAGYARDHGWTVGTVVPITLPE